MAGALDCSCSGLDKGPNGLGQVTLFLSTTRLFRNRELHYDATPQVLWSELLSKVLKESVQNLGKSFVPKNRYDEYERCVVLQLLPQFDGRLLGLLAEGGQAHVYRAKYGNTSMPVLVKRLKHGNVDLVALQRRMEMVMKVRRQNKSANCRVFSVGVDLVGNVWILLEQVPADFDTLLEGTSYLDDCSMPFAHNNAIAANVWILMERMPGDLCTLIEHRMRYLEDGKTPFAYKDTIMMMMEIARGMEELHRYDFIHTQASNILVRHVVMYRYREKIDGSQRSPDWMCLYARIGNIQTLDNGMIMGIYRKVMLALNNGTNPIFSPAANIFSCGMSRYELLTGRIPFVTGGRPVLYDVVVLSGRRPWLPACGNLMMTRRLYACWLPMPWEWPGWVSILKTLKEELMLQPQAPQPSKRWSESCIEKKLKKTEDAIWRQCVVSDFLLTALESKRKAEQRIERGWKGNEIAIMRQCMVSDFLLTTLESKRKAELRIERGWKGNEIEIVNGNFSSNVWKQSLLKVLCRGSSSTVEVQIFRKMFVRDFLLTPHESKRRGEEGLGREMKGNEKAIMNVNFSSNVWVQSWVKASARGVCATAKADDFRKVLLFLDFISKLNEAPRLDPNFINFLNPATVQQFDAGRCATTEAKTVPEMFPILLVISELKKASWRNQNFMNFLNLQPTFRDVNSTSNEIMFGFFKVWLLVENTWANHVAGRTGGKWETDLIDGAEMETLEECEIVAKRATERTVCEIRANEILESYNLLGPTAKDWLKKIFATSKMAGCPSNRK
ncbi:unnamed protein product [Sphagnum jensenii]|uniref:Protein kinase domain-containing protein n=1 Tax=Sphagnum jensenii TaxID=128206 RepID=A0ABP0W739_9BRYO